MEDLRPLVVACENEEDADQKRFMKFVLDLLRLGLVESLGLTANPVLIELSDDDESPKKLMTDAEMDLINRSLFDCLKFVPPESFDSDYAQ